MAVKKISTSRTGICYGKDKNSSKAKLQENSQTTKKNEEG